MSVHIELEELADAAAGALDADRSDAVDNHVHSCLQCRESWSALASVGRRLSAEPAPTMPPDVSRRLGEVLAAESVARAQGVAELQHGAPAPRTSTAHRLRPTLGPFGADLLGRSRTFRTPQVLAACAAAGLVGFGGYVLSAAVGLNEPAQIAPTVISSAKLASEAQALQRATDLDPHRFSRAWRCARQVTSGRITGLTPASVDGQPSLLVYTRVEGAGTGAATMVTVVRGCNTAQPTAGPSTRVPR